MPNQISYKNPWYKPGRQKTFTRTDCKVEVSPCGRGSIVSVYKDHHDYLIGGAVVTQRAGKGIGILNSLIAVILDGKEGGYSEQQAKKTFDRQMTGRAA